MSKSLLNSRVQTWLRNQEVLNGTWSRLTSSFRKAKDITSKVHDDHKKFRSIPNYSIIML